jgi:hypothetical protein
MTLYKVCIEYVLISEEKEWDKKKIFNAFEIEVIS